jgi:hypothetical protein
MPCPTVGSHDTGRESRVNTPCRLIRTVSSAIPLCSFARSATARPPGRYVSHHRYGHDGKQARAERDVHRPCLRQCADIARDKDFDPAAIDAALGGRPALEPEGAAIAGWQRPGDAYQTIESELVSVRRVARSTRIRDDGCRAAGSVGVASPREMSLSRFMVVVVMKWTRPCADGRVPAGCG